MGFGGTPHSSPTAPAPLYLPVIGSPNILGHFGASPSLSEQPLSKPPPAVAPSYQNLSVHAQNNPQAGAVHPLRHKQISAQVLTLATQAWGNGVLSRAGPGCSCVN